MGTSRRLVLVLCIGLLISATGALWVRASDNTSVGPDDPTLVAVPPATTSTSTAAPTSTSTTAPPVTTTTATATATATARRQSGPVRVPSNPYANEPLVELGTIEIPKIGLTHPVFEGISLRTIDHGPSHWPGTALPGQVGNAVFAGHRVTHTHPFRNIDQLAIGDQVIFNINGVRFTYAVSGSEVVTPKELRIVNQSPTPTATIFGCHPPGSAKFRYVVHLSLQS